MEPSNKANHTAKISTISSSSAGSSHKRKTVGITGHLGPTFPHGLSLRREHWKHVRLDGEWLTTVRYRLVVLAAVQARKKFSELTLKIRTRPVTSGILPQDLLDLSHSPRCLHGPRPQEPLFCYSLPPAESSGHLNRITDLQGNFVYLGPGRLVIHTYVGRHRPCAHRRQRTYAGRA